MDEKLVKREKAIKFNTQWYVGAIVDIFAESRKDDETPVIAVNIGKSDDSMQIEVAYSAEQVANNQFFKESGLNEIPEGQVVKEIVENINQDEPPEFYRTKIVEYFKENLSEDFEVNEFLITLKQ